MMLQRLESSTLEELREIVDRLFWPNYSKGLDKDSCILEILAIPENTNCLGAHENF